MSEATESVSQGLLERLQAREELLKKQNGILLRLAKSEALDAGLLDRALQEITEAAAEAQDTERASVWVYNEDQTGIVCLDLFERTSGKHSSGLSLNKQDFPAYFQYLAEERSLPAHDAHTDPSTFEFSEVYLKPLGINSMLDAPIRLFGRMVGVICHEQVGPARTWNQEEINFAGSMADIIARAMEAAERKKAQDDLQKANAELEERVRQRTAELSARMEEISRLKEIQDGDYYLTALIAEPLGLNLNKSTLATTEFLLDQKKKFTFRGKSAQIGGDLCVTGNLRFGDGRDRYVMFLNGDAMGKSMQGAGGAIVMGTAINNIMGRSARNSRILEQTPRDWLEETYEELQSIFRTFNESMVISAVVGVLNERTGELWYFNAEHPWPILLRDGRASFLEGERPMYKLGSHLPSSFEPLHFELRPGDVIIVGSDGKDDLEVSGADQDASKHIDERRILGIVEEAGGSLERIYALLNADASLTDDISLLRIAYQCAPAQAKEHPIGLRAREAMSAGNLEAAARLYAQGLAEQPEDQALLFGSVVCAKRRRDVGAALEAGRRLLGLNPNHLANLLNLADSLRVSGQTAEAKQLLWRAQELSPDHEQVRRLGSLLRT